jgi:hypothetical protein
MRGKNKNILEKIDYYFTRVPYKLYVVASLLTLGVVASSLYEYVNQDMTSYNTFQTIKRTQEEIENGSFVVGESLSNQVATFNLTQLNDISTPSNVNFSRSYIYR